MQSSETPVLYRGGTVPKGLWGTWGEQHKKLWYSRNYTKYLEITVY